MLLLAMIKALSSLLFKLNIFFCANITEIFEVLRIHGISLSLY